MKEFANCGKTFKHCLTAIWAASISSPSFWVWQMCLLSILEYFIYNRCTWVSSLSLSTTSINIIMNTVSSPRNGCMHDFIWLYRSFAASGGKGIYCRISLILTPWHPDEFAWNDFLNNHKILNVYCTLNWLRSWSLKTKFISSSTLLMLNPRTITSIRAFDMLAFRRWNCVEMHRLATSWSEHTWPRIRSLNINVVNPKFKSNKSYSIRSGHWYLTLGSVTWSSYWSSKWIEETRDVVWGRNLCIPP